MTTPTGKPRGRPRGLAKTGGRVAGGKSLDRGQRQLVSSELAGSIMATFEGLGSTEGMLAWAADNKTVFYTQILSRLMPAPQKDDADFVQNNTQINVNNLSPMESARRVAYALAVGLHPDPSVAPRDITPVEPMTPQKACDWRNPTPPYTPPPEPAYQPPEDPDRDRWVAELPLTEEQRQDNALIRQTKESSITNYAGSGAEQGYGQRQPSATARKPTAVELCRRLSRNGRDLI
ncbi:hypothetical protein [Pseudomonas putida]|uniref:hypothetical protein n=1 Tax=Pseudomonas putida TaxID=303 RepID=UPI003D96D650